MIRSAHQFILFLLVTLLTAGSSIRAEDEKKASGPTLLPYPDTRRTDQVDEYHGVMVADPYRWLEQDVRESKKVADWVAAENRVTSAYLDSLPQRKVIEKRLTELWNYPKYSSPSKVGGRYYYLKNSGLQNQSVLYTMDALDAPARVLIDPNTWSKDGTVALEGVEPSDDGRYLAFGKAEAGSDWQTWHVMELATGKTLPDVLRWIKFTNVSWTPEGRGFFYSRFDEPKKGESHQQVNLNQKLFYHRVGTPQSDDVLVYHRPDEPKWGFIGSVTEDGRYLVITVHVGTDDRYRILVKDLNEPYGMPVDLITNFEHEFSLVGNDGPRLFFVNNTDAPRGRVIAIDLRQPDEKHWKVIIPQDKNTLLGASVVGNLLIAQYLDDVKPQVKLFTLDGRFVREVAFPGIGSASGFGGRRADTETFYTFSSYDTPPSIYRYDLITGKSTLLRRAEVKFDPEAYEVKQIFYKSKDGTRVPMILAHRKGMKLDGKQPTLLYGYGGFDVSILPRFRVTALMWMEMGGVFAVPNIRGGGEYGEAWHKAGTKLVKQNTFDDFIAAAEWLIDNKYTRPDRLAILGRSNGGLLVGAVMVQRPDLFGACLPGVGVMDMLRFHQFTAGRYWVDDYGSADNPEEFKVLWAYSPYHNLKPGVKYPATLVTTADTDDRVVPAHSFKFAAALQHAQAGKAPVLIRIETRAGHGMATPTTKLIEQTADEWAFLAENLGMKIEGAGDEGRGAG
ncbi:MAG: S9 family peptidase, partial [Pirellulales bacterium]|nr:S9 family peptidase [Pirellulales bacterium]